ncbi:MAG TPA: hypothetical protein VLG76_05350 [Rhabdochlamydiaceae bacterium]|nr:hypothetical protein [Rhabdochlamydiaceae bacterium]
MTARAAFFATVLLTTFYAYASRQVEPQTTTKAAFDLGSGRFKMVVAEMENNQIKKIKCATGIDVLLANDLAQNKGGKLSPTIQKAALVALSQLKKEAEKLGSTAYSGVATAVFRKATNGEDLLKELSNQTSIPLRILSQDQEGETGFNTARAVFPEINEQNLISWDSGNASFQIVSKTDHNYDVYQGPLGHSQVLQLLSENVRKRPYRQADQVNPVSEEERAALIGEVQDKIALPKWLENKLKNQGSIVAIGDISSIFGVASTMLKKNSFSIAEVRTFLEETTNKTDREMISQFGPVSDPKGTVTRLVLLYAVMSKFGIEQVDYRETAGSTLGVLLTKEFWKA